MAFTPPPVENIVESGFTPPRPEDIVGGEDQPQDMSLKSIMSRALAKSKKQTEQTTKDWDKAAIFADKVLTSAGQQLGDSIKALTLLPFDKELATQQIAGEPGEKPYEEGMAALPKPLRMASTGVMGIVDTAPRLAAFMVPGVGPAAGPLAFGATPEGFSSMEAALAAVAPAVGSKVGKYAEVAAKKAGVTSDAMLKLINKTVGAGTVATAFTAPSAVKVAQMPEGEEKDKAIEDLAAGFAVNALMGGMGHMERPTTSERPTMGERPNMYPDISGSIIDIIGPKGAPKPPLAPLLTPEQAEAGLREPVDVSGEQFDVMDLGKMESRVPTAGNLPFKGISDQLVASKKAKAEVPGTPAEERVSAVDEIRAKKADTIAKIQSLFPDAKLTREQARVMRDAAFPKEKPSEQPSQLLEAPVQTVAPPIVPKGATPFSPVPPPEVRAQPVPVLEAAKPVAKKKFTPPPVTEMVEAPKPAEAPAISPAPTTPRRTQIIPAPKAKKVAGETITPQDLRPALKVGKDVVVGGETHQEIANNHGEEGQKAISDDSNHIFVDNQGRRYNRKQAAKAIGSAGELHSEDLIDLKKGAKPEPVAKQPTEAPAIAQKPAPAAPEATVEAPAATEPVPASKPATVAAIKARKARTPKAQAVHNHIQQEFAGIADQVEVVNTAADLPDAVKGMASRQGIDINSIDGTYHEGKVYINADQMGNLQKVRDKVVHELAIHKGLREALGPEKHSVAMRDIWNQMTDAEKKSVTDRDPSAQGEEHIAEEWLAYEAERVARSGKTNTTWTRIANMVRNALRRLGFKVRFTDMEIAKMVSKGFEAVSGEGAGETRFSISDSPDKSKSHGLDILEGKAKPVGLPERPKVIEVARYFQDRYGEPVDFNTATPEQNKVVEDLVYSEVKHALDLHPEAVGWYGANTTLAIDVLKELHPELSNPTDEFILKAAMTVTSNGNKVDPQFNQSHNIYKEWKKTGRINGVHAFGARVGKIREHLKLIQIIADKLGLLGAKEFLLRKGTPSELRKAFHEEIGLPKNVANKFGKGESANTKFPFSAVFGPKLGSFLNNLYQDFSTVTMDVWFMRALGRLSGTYVQRISPKTFSESRVRLRNAIGKITADQRRDLGISLSDATGSKIDEIATKIAGKFKSANADPLLDEVRLAARHHEKIMEPTVDAPLGPKHRDWIRDRVDQIQKRLKADGINIENADLQALLWYNEKELYAKLKYVGDKKNSGTNDYAAAAEAVYARERGRPSNIYAGSAGRVGEIGRSRGVEPMAESTTRLSVSPEEEKTGSLATEPPSRISNVNDNVNRAVKNLYQRPQGTTSEEILNTIAKLPPVPGKPGEFQAINAVITQPTRLSISAFHGTPAKIKEKFSTEYVGEGTGTVYGWGLYFSKAIDIAKAYASGFSAEKLKGYFKPGAVVPSFGGKDTVVSFNEGEKGNWSVTVKGEDGRERTHSTVPNIKDLKKAGIEPGNLYTAELNFDSEDCLNWDKGFKDQSPKVQEALKSIIPMLSENDRITVLDENGNIKPDASGGVFYGMLKKQITDGWDSKPASLHLLGLGVKGIEFKAKRQDESANFVVFDDKDILITHENGMQISANEATGTSPETRLSVSPEKSSPEEAGDIYGIAHDIRQARADAGKVAYVPRGAGTNVETAIEHGRFLLRKGRDPIKEMEKFENTRAVSFNALTIARAYGERLALEADAIAKRYGINSPQYRAARDIHTLWETRSKAMQTEWSNIGKGQQGFTDIDTGSVTGLQKEYKDSTGKDFTEKQAKEAEKLAENVQKANLEKLEAEKKVKEALSTPPYSDYILKMAERIVGQLDSGANAARDLLKRTMFSLSPEHLRALAEIGASHIGHYGTDPMEFRKALVEEFGEKVSPEIEKIYTESLKVIDQVAEKIAGKVSSTAAKAAKKIAPNEAETAKIKIKPTDNMDAKDIMKVWKHTKTKYIDNDIFNFDDIRNGVATDFGIPVKEVTKIFAANKSVKKITDEAYIKAARARAVSNNAKRWLKMQQYSNMQRYFMAVPRAMFNLAIFGHSTVFLGTHAPQNVYLPQRWKSLYQGYINMWKFSYGNPAFHEGEMADLQRRKNFVKAKRAGLNNDPLKAEEGYSDDPALLKKLIAMGIGNKAADTLKVIRQDIFDMHWDKLADTHKTDQMAKMIADLANHATGTVRNKGGESQWANLLFFAPRLAKSRLMWEIGDPVKAVWYAAKGSKSTPEERRFIWDQMVEKGTVLAVYASMLAANQGMLSAVGSNQKINFSDPYGPDWMRFKGFGFEFAPFSTGLALIREIAKIVKDARSPRSKIERMKGTRQQQAAKDLFAYGRSQFSPFAGTGTELTFREDYAGRPLPNNPEPPPTWMRKHGIAPYDWAEYAMTKLPIPITEPFLEGYRHHKIGDDNLALYAKLFGEAAVRIATGVYVGEERSYEYRK